MSLTETLKNYAQTGSEYTKILNQIITQNRLSDFERVRLVNSVKQNRIKFIIIFHSQRIEYLTISNSHHFPLKNNLFYHVHQQIFLKY